MCLKRHLISVLHPHPHLFLLQLSPFQKMTLIFTLSFKPKSFYVVLEYFQAYHAFSPSAGSVYSFFLEQYFLNLLISHLPQFSCPYPNHLIFPGLRNFSAFLIILIVSIPFLLQTLFYKAGSLIIYKSKSHHTLFCSDSAVSFFLFHRKANFNLT